MVAVPVLVTLTDRIDAKRVYLFGVGCTMAGHLLFGALADGFWSALALRALAGIGWAGTYMTGLKLLADQVDARMMSRAVGRPRREHRHLRRALLLRGRAARRDFGWRVAFVVAAGARRIAGSLVRSLVPCRGPRRLPRRGRSRRCSTSGRSAQPLGDGLCARLLRAHAGDERAARLGRGVLGLRRGQHGRRRRRCCRPRSSSRAGSARHRHERRWATRPSIRFGRRRLIAVAMVLSIVVGAASDSSGTGLSGRRRRCCCSTA